MTARLAVADFALAGFLIGIAAACDGAGHAAPLAPQPVSIVVYNNLAAPVTIAVDGVPALGLKSGASSGLTVPSTAQFLMWTSAKPTGADGQPIPDEIGDVKVSVAGINRVLDIDNVIEGEPYITARIINHTNSAVSIGVYDGTAVSCAAALPASTSSTTAFTITGYYRLRPATEIRAFRDATRCIGPYTAWPAAELKGFASKSGVLTLSLDSAP